jgi:hypothetical protein
MPSTINVIPDKQIGQLRKNGAADGNLAFQTNGTNAVVIDSNQNANFVSTGAITLPKGTIAQRPASPVNGMWRYSTSYAGVEAYANGSWLNLTPILTPINSAAPVLSGSTVVGSNVSVSTGTWNNSPTSYGYQWLANSVAISNATANVFTITSSQNGSNLSCNVTATNGAGSTGIAATSNTAGPVTSTYSASYLVIAGGGGGGSGQTNSSGGGGGAGGYLANTATFTPGVVYTATVGAGGGSGGGGTNSSLSGTGLTTVTSIGGGNGGGSGGGAGGSGGGSGSGYGGSPNGGAATSGQGNGGSGTGYDGQVDPGGGGGGAGGSGSGSSGGAAASSSITGSSVSRAGGGGGGKGGSGGGGGAGNGGYSSGGGSGSANTGSGGGGGGQNGGGPQSGGSGGSGIIILSVPTTNYSGTTTGSPTVTTSGSNTIITFTSSGTYTA